MSLVRFWSVVAFVVTTGSAIAGESATSDVPSSVAYERVECFGRCPSYKVAISSDGTVKYNGGKNVVLIGPATKKVPPSQVAPLFQKIQELNFMMLDGKSDGRKMKENGDVIGPIPADFPSYFLTVVQDGRSKKVGGVPGEPYVERDLPDLIIEVAGVAEWVKSTNPFEGRAPKEMSTRPNSPASTATLPAPAPKEAAQPSAPKK